MMVRRAVSEDLARVDEILAAAELPALPPHLPLSNLLMAIFWVLVVRLALMLGSGVGDVSIFLVYIGVAGIIINTVLMILNMLPIPPLDGGRVLGALLPGPWSWQLSRLEPYGLPILILLLATGMLGKIIGPLINMTVSTLIGFSGL